MKFSTIELIDWLGHTSQVSIEYINEIFNREAELIILTGPSN